MVQQDEGALRGSDLATVKDEGHVDALQAGAVIGKYRIVEVLGQGGFGITYRAIDTQLHRPVAIKEYLPIFFAARQGGSHVLPRSTRMAEDFRWGRARFLEEARILARLTDAPGIVSVFDFIEANGTAYMVMSLVEGETLESLLRRERRLAQSTIQNILPRLLAGLERAHAAGIVHRDIKPANIMLDAQLNPTLIDFGASRAALADRTHAMTAVYTAAYAPFEQVMSDTQGPYTDIFALAATLYHCVTGEPPVASAKRMAADTIAPAVQAVKGRYAPSLLAAIDAGLVLRATDRPQSIAAWRPMFYATARATELQAIEPVAEPTKRVPPPAPTAAPARPKSRTWRNVGLAVLALLILGGGAIGLQQYQRAEQERLRLEQEKQQREAAERRRLAQLETERLAREQQERERAAAAQTVLTLAKQAAGGWQLNWDSTESTWMTVIIDPASEAGPLTGRLVIQSRSRPLATQPLRVTVTADELRIEAVGTSSPTWRPQQFVFALSPANPLAGNRLIGRSLAGGAEPVTMVRNR